MINQHQYRTSLTLPRFKMWKIWLKQQLTGCRLCPLHFGYILCIAYIVQSKYIELNSPSTAFVATPCITLITAMSSPPAAPTWSAHRKWWTPPNDLANIEPGRTGEFSLNTQSGIKEYMLFIYHANQIKVESCSCTTAVWVWGYFRWRGGVTVGVYCWFLHVCWYKRRGSSLFV